MNKKSDNSLISTFTYTHDNVGNRLTMLTSEGTHNYGYDNIYRLTSADHPIQTDENFTYDKVGNRKTSSLYPNWTYDANNRLTSYNGTSYNYDNNGNMVEREGTVPEQGLSLTYDYENRLIAISGTTNANYAYNPSGKRLSKTVDGVTKYYLYDNEDIIAEYDASGSLITTFTHGLGIDEPIKGLSPQGTVPEWYYTFDGLGTVSEVTDSAGSAVESYKYDAFGKIEAPPTTRNPYTYTGREYDAESGLYFYRARYYDAGVGRFINPDPLKFRGEINFYVYASNNPVIFVDPYGLWTCGNPGYGNWGGACWSGGQTRPLESLTDEERKRLLPPIDSMDECFKGHDECFSKCYMERDPCNPNRRAFANCINGCHRSLFGCLASLDSDPRRWPRPAPDPNLARKKLAEAKAFAWVAKW